MELKCLTVRDLMKDGSIVVDHVDTYSILVYPLTKGLRHVVFKQHVENKGIVSSFYIFVIGNFRFILFPFSCCWILILNFGK